ncbi:hypothetical protein EV175_005665, partial [Coemansia sp. RSA 1933]
LLAAHMQEHQRDADKRLASKIFCANKACDGERNSGNPLDLCTMCYSPLIVVNYDPGYMKLLLKLKRRVLSVQMEYGCSIPNCADRGLYCATSLSDAENNAKTDLIIYAYTLVVRNTGGTQPTVFDDIGS